jgi:hypothetical protein
LKKIRTKKKTVTLNSGIMTKQNKIKPTYHDPKR